MLLAMFLNTAIRPAGSHEAHRDRPPGSPTRGRASSPSSTQRTGEALEPLLNEGDRDEVLKSTMAVVRGTVQADILKEDQAQNTCIFSTEFALRMMGDIQQLLLSITKRATTTTRSSASAATTSPRPGRTPSASSPSPSPTASRYVEYVPGPRHAHRPVRGTTSVLLLLQRPRPRVHRHRAGGPAHLGGRDA